MLRWPWIIAAVIGVVMLVFPPIGWATTYGRLTSPTYGMVGMMEGNQTIDWWRLFCQFAIIAAFAYAFDRRYALRFPETEYVMVNQDLYSSIPPFAAQFDVEKIRALAVYVDRELRRGKLRQEIVSESKKSGWNEETINWLVSGLLRYGETLIRDI